jgi:hypothetical protein
LKSKQALATDVVKYFFGGAGAPVGHVIKPLADSLFRIRTGGDVEQALVGFGVLHDGGSPPLDVEHHRALAFLQLLDEVAGTAAEGRQRLDVFGDVQPEPAPKKHLFKCYRNTIPVERKRPHALASLALLVSPCGHQ